jgi:hypothetical protein
MVPVLSQMNPVLVLMPSFLNVKYPPTGITMKMEALTLYAIGQLQSMR